MKTSESIDKLAAALVEVQSQIEGAEKNKVNPHLKNKYADLTSIWEACREALTKSGFAVVQSPEWRDGLAGVMMVTRLLHSSGQWLEGELFMPVAKSDAQAYGSAVSYGRRYALAAMVGVVADDDDGNAASGTGSSGGGQPTALEKQIMQLGGNLFKLSGTTLNTRVLEAATNILGGERVESLAQLSNEELTRVRDALANPPKKAA
jgi:hypothetical protein